METIPLFKVFMSEDVLAPVNKVLLSGYVGQGPAVDHFESLLARYLDTPYTVTINSATAGLHLALRLLKRSEQNPQGLEDGDEVISTPLTCTATNWPILANNLRIKWADVDPTTCNIDPEDISRKLSPRTRAIMVVHWTGNPCNLIALKRVQNECQERFGFTPPIIEDCAHAWGATYEGRPLGNHGNLCVYSFQAIKTFTTCDGGLLVLPDQELDRRARLLRWYGLDRTSSKDFRCAQDIEEWGYKFHMNDVNATIGIYNFPHISGLIQKQQENSAYFDEALCNVPGVTQVGGGNPPGVATSACWIYTIRVEHRADFERKMADAGIMVSRVHARNDTHTTVQEFRTHLPGVDIADGEMISIPCGWWVTPENREYIARTIQSGW